MAGNSLEALDKAIKGAPWLSEADSAAVDLAQKLAGAIDSVSPRELAPLARLYADVLKDLGLTVGGRADKPEVQREGNRLDELRQEAGQPIAAPKKRSVKSAQPRRSDS